jgi:hypothetical protein
VWQRGKINAAAVPHRTQVQVVFHAGSPVRASFGTWSETCFGTRSQAQVLIRIHAIAHNLPTPTTRCTARPQKPNGNLA